VAAGKAVIFYFGGKHSHFSTTLLLVFNGHWLLNILLKGATD